MESIRIQSSFWSLMYWVVRESFSGPSRRSNSERLVLIPRAIPAFDRFSLFIAVL